jgi:uncharacterized protein
VRADSNIKSIKDMKGKRITYGLTSQEIVRKTIDAMLATGGLTIKDLTPVLVPNVVAGADNLAAGRVDISVFAVGAPKVAEVDAAVGVRFIPIDNSPAALAALKKEFPTGYIDRMQPAPNMAGVKEPMDTMFYDYAVFAGADVPADRVKQITAIIAENKDALAQGQPLFKDMTKERLFTNFNVPFHPGAIAYFNEKSIKETK